MPLEEVANKGVDSQSMLNQEWIEFERTGGRDASDYYRKNTTYLYNLTHWHANYGETEARVRVLEYYKKHGLKNVLDFGSGIGSTSILMASNGLNPSSADVAESLLER